MNDESKLIALARELGALQYGDFELVSGQRSNIYFDGRRLSLHPRALGLVTDLLWAKIEPLAIDAIAGPVVSSVPIVGALVYKAALSSRSLCGAFVRKEAKKHGTQSQIEGAINEISGAQVAMVEDTVTTGQSIFSAIDALHRAGHTVTHTFAIFDRGEQTTANFAARGVKFHALLTMEQALAAS